MEKKQLKYKAEVDLVQGTLKGVGDTPWDAIENISLTWADIKSKGTIRIKYGKKKSEKYFTLFLLRRMFASKPYRVMQSKYLVQLLK